MIRILSQKHNLKGCYDQNLIIKDLHPILYKSILCFADKKKFKRSPKKTKN